jgi:hypothetical protein
MCHDHGHNFFVLHFHRSFLATYVLQEDWALLDELCLVWVLADVGIASNQKIDNSTSIQANI